MTDQEAEDRARMILESLAGDRLRQLKTAVLNAHASGYAAGCQAEARIQEERRRRAPPEMTAANVITDVLELVQAPTVGDDWQGRPPGEVVILALSKAGWRTVRDDSLDRPPAAPESQT